MVAVGSNNKILMQASYFRYDHIDFVTNIEDTLHYVIMAGSITIIYNFYPMPTIKRKIIHELYVHYGCISKSFGTNPVRCVRVELKR